MKKFFFLTLSFFLFIFLILIFDIIISNSILSYKNCYKYEEYFYELKKNCKGKYRFKKSFPIVETITDEMGLRIGKDSPLKDIGKKNIFIFGDSFTYGIGIEYDKTYAGLIEKEKKNHNVYNFGVGSYSPSVYLYKLKKSIKNNIIPSKIILFLDLTDVLDEATRWHYDEQINEIKLYSNNLYKLSKVQEKFKKKNFKILTNISTYINFNLRNIREKTNIKLGNERKIKTSIQGSFTYLEKKSLDKKFWKNNAFDKGINKIKKILLQISEIAKQNNSEFYVVVYPWSETLQFGQKKFNWSNYIYEICNDNNCIAIDAIPSFIEYKNNNINWSTDLYFLNDEHFNKKGAQLLYKTVIKNIK